MLFDKNEKKNQFKLEIAWVGPFCGYNLILE